MSISKDKLHTIFYGNLYAMMLIYVYINQISNTFSYAGFPLTYSPINVILCLCVITTMTFTMRAVNTVVNRVLQIVMVFFFFPAVVYLFIAEFNVTYASLLLLSFLTLNSLRKKQIGLRTLGISTNWVFRFLTWTALVILLFNALFANGIKFNFNILDVYTFRSDNAEALPGIFGYINSVFAKIIIPFGIIVALYKRNILLIFFFFISGIVLFGIGQHKSYLIAPVMPLMYYIMIKMSRKHTYRLFYIPISLVSLSVVETFILANYVGASGIGFINSFFVRRGLFLPVFLDIETIKFFTLNEIYLWSSSKITMGMVAMPYDDKAAFTIGYHLFGDVDHAANTGLIGSGFANGRYLGAVIYVFIISIVLLFLNRLRTNDADLVIGSAVVSIFLYAFNTTDLVTMFISHGLIIVVFMPLFLKSRE